MSNYKTIAMSLKIPAHLDGDEEDAKRIPIEAGGP